jgi:cysteine desulfurase/selenocysteine lyase
LKKRVRFFSTAPSIPGPVPAAGSTRLLADPINPFAVPLDQSALQLSGTVVHPPDHRAPVSHDPQSQPHPLYSASNTDFAESPKTHPEQIGDLGISSTSFDVEAIRRDFPILREEVHGRPLIWFDNGATTQKPQSVIDRISYFYEHENSNVHRAAHELAARATDAYESAREKTRRFLNAGSTREIIFVRGATEGINLVAQSWGRRNIQKDDEIVVSWLEHHANIVPWQMLCAETGARLRVAPVDDSGQILLDEYEKLLGPKTRLVSITQVSNALGTIAPVEEMVEAAHRHGALVLVDGAQAVSHMRVDVQSIGCDFYVFSGHKVFAPTGIGVVYGRSEVLENMPPWQGGGNMIQDVTFEKTTYKPPPQRFEAGTGNIADAVGLGAAIDYLDRVGIVNVSRHEHMLLTYATAELQRIPGLTIIGTAKEKASVLSFVIEGLRTEEVGDYLNRRGIAVRGGHHCAQPILRRFGLESTVRATFALYNTCEEVDELIAALWDVRQGRNIGLA